MTINEEMQIPYVSPELVKYLRETYSLPNTLHMMDSADNADIAMGFLFGINTLIERLEAIKVQQEENDGIH